jgi:prepilin peptidase CpaA
MIPPSSNPYSLAGGACFALAGAAFDLRWRRIPNRLTGAALLIALVLNTLTGGMRGLLDSLAACLLAGGAFAIMFFMGGMGGGDVKLMAAIAAFAGLAHLAPLLLATALAGGVFALVMAIVHGSLGCTLRGMFGWIWPRRRSHYDSANNAVSRLYLPYGVPIAVGALLTFYSGVLAS